MGGSNQAVSDSDYGKKPELQKWLTLLSLFILIINIEDYYLQVYNSHMCYL